MAYTLHTDIKAKSISYGGSRTASDIKYIVIHYTGNKTDKAVNNAKYFRDSNLRAAGAHYFVDETSIYQSIDDLKIAYAVGGSKYNNNGGCMYGKITNKNSISIEMCSTNGKIADDTIANVVALCKKLMLKYKIPESNIRRHWDVNGKPCPGWTGWIGSDQSIWNNVKKLLSGSTTTTVTRKTYSKTFPTVSPALKKGSKGTQVNRLQNFLNWYGGYGLLVDSVFGNATDKAVRDFQKREKLTVDGIFGSKSLLKAMEVKK